MNQKSLFSITIGGDMNKWSHVCTGNRYFAGHSVVFFLETLLGIQGPTVLWANTTRILLISIELGQLYVLNQVVAMHKRIILKTYLAFCHIQHNMFW